MIRDIFTKAIDPANAEYHIVHTYENGKLCFYIEDSSPEKNRHTLTREEQVYADLTDLFKNIYPPFKFDPSLIATHLVGIRPMTKIPSTIYTPQITKSKRKEDDI